MDDNFFDGFENKESKPKKRPKRDYLSDLEPTPKKKSKNKPKSFLIHIIIVIILLLFLTVYLLSDYSFDFNSAQEPTQKTITLIGNLNSFNEQYTGDLKLISNQFILETPTTVFKDDSQKEFFIYNFSGLIYLKNNSIIISGKSSQIIFGENSVDLKDSEFQINSTIKTVIELTFKNVSLDFEKGRILLDDTLNYEFINSTITLNNFNTSITYDNVFSFIGYANSFTLDSKQENLKISYTK